MSSQLERDLGVERSPNIKMGVWTRSNVAADLGAPPEAEFAAKPRVDHNSAYQQALAEIEEENKSSLKENTDRENMRQAALERSILGQELRGAHPEFAAKISAGTGPLSNLERELGVQRITAQTDVWKQKQIEAGKPVKAPEPIDKKKKSLDDELTSLEAIPPDQRTPAQKQRRDDILGLPRPEKEKPPARIPIGEQMDEIRATPEEQRTPEQKQRLAAYDKDKVSTAEGAWRRIINKTGTDEDRERVGLINPGEARKQRFNELQTYLDVIAPKDSFGERNIIPGYETEYTKIMGEWTRLMKDQSGAGPARPAAPAKPLLAPSPAQPGINPVIQAEIQNSLASGISKEQIKQELQDNGIDPALYGLE